jgi:predicted RNA-binding protein with PUA-like domain
MNYWLFKSEPDVYSLNDLKKDKKTAWNNVRNYQARNFLKQCKKNDLVLYYHSNKERSVVGLGRIVKEGYEEIDKIRPGEWVQVDVGFVTRLVKPVTLEMIKSTPALSNLLLIKQSRLSCMPVGEKEFKLIVKMGGLSASEL